MLFSHWLFWLKICRFSTNSSIGFIASLKTNHYAYILPYMHKTLPTLENEKEQLQINFDQKFLADD